MPRRNRGDGEIRIRRFQRSRRCKRTRFDFESNLQLQDLPDDVIREILEFSMPKIRSSEYSTDRWMWICQIGAMCRAFHRVSKQLSTPALYLPPYALSIDLHNAFVRSFLDPTKALSVRHLVIDLYRTQLYDLVTTVQSLLTTPGLFVNVTCLNLRGFGVYAGNLHSTINQLCRNLPNLTDLTLWGQNPAPGMPSLSVEQFSSFASGLPRPLHKLRINGPLFTKAQIMEFIRQKGRELESLHLCHRLNVTEDNILDDESLLSIAQHCPQLVALSIPYSNITSQGFEVFFRAHRSSFVHLDVSECQILTAQVIHHLVNYAPGLQHFSASGCVWFDDEGLETLVQGQLERMRQSGADNAIPLENVSAYGSSVTVAAARRNVAKDGVGKLCISARGFIERHSP